MNVNSELPTKITRKKEIRKTRQEAELCETCRGRGWIYLRTYEICPECQGIVQVKTQDAAQRPVLLSSGA